MNKNIFWWFALSAYGLPSLFLLMRAIFVTAYQKQLYESGFWLMMLWGSIVSVISIFWQTDGCLSLIVPKKSNQYRGYNYG